MPRRIPIFVIALLLSACAPASALPDQQHTEAAPAVPVVAPSSTPIAEPAPPPGINPLTGLPAVDPKLLTTPAQLISISHFPAYARPQAGLSFAPFVYEISITEGATRFLAVFYGEYPSPEVPPVGECVLRTGAFVQTDLILGGQVWLDANDNALHDLDERPAQRGTFGGVGGVCVNLFDASANLLAQTTTDSNGYYGFNVAPGHYSLELIKPEWTRFGSGAIQGRRTELDISGDMTELDAGLVPLDPSILIPDPYQLPPAQVGPIRSGRLVYRYLADSFPNSCLIYAGASSEVLVHLPQCYLAYHQFAGGGYMMDIDELREVAKQNRREEGQDFDYGGYFFASEPPAGGAPATQINVYIAYQNQSGWTYDPLYQAYLRFVDTSEKDLAGVLFPDRDRLTGRQLHFENVIVLFAPHHVVSPTNLDIRLQPGKAGDALLFRDGLMYEIEWRMPAEDEASRMLQFLDTKGDPIPLKPGHTWVLVVTPDSTVEAKPTGAWTILFIPPEGAQ